MLFEYAPWLNYNQEARQTRRPVEQNTSVSVAMRELVRAATLAASGHNTQPWTFAITENAIAIHPDYTRQLAAVDPNDRELWISLGCALENLLVAAHTAGYATDVTYPDAGDVIHIRLSADTSPVSPLFNAIRLRQNTRSAYDSQPIPNTDLSKLEAVPLEPGVQLHLITSPTARETMVEYVSYPGLKLLGLSLALLTTRYQHPRRMAHRHAPCEQYCPQRSHLLAQRSRKLCKQTRLESCG